MPVKIIQVAFERFFRHRPGASRGLTVQDIDGLYYGEGHCSCCHPHFPSPQGRSAGASFSFSADVLAAFMRKVYRGFDTAAGVEPAMWREVLRIVNSATVEGLAEAGAPPTHETGFYAALRYSNEVFAAFKVHNMGRLMASRLIGADGKLKPFGKWAEEVAPITSHHVGAWLRTEYDTALIRAHNATDWRRFERDKDVMPNLRWMPTTSPTPESSHRAFWERRLTLPVDDPFWNEHHPGDRWNCKCSLEQTDKPATPELKAEFDGLRPQRGLENNTGRDGRTFSDNHPYFPESCAKCGFYRKANIKNRILGGFTNRQKDCYNCPYIDGCIDRAKEIAIVRERAKEIRNQAAFLKGMKLENKVFAHEVTVSGAGIKEWLNQPHIHFMEKNELLLSLPDVFRNAKYIGATIDDKPRQGVVQSHVFETKIMEDSSWIIVHQMNWGEYLLHGISDSKKIADSIK